MKLLASLAVMLLLAVAAFAQTVKPEEQARIKPLLEEMKKAQEPFIAKRKTLPEEKAVADAQAAFDAAQTKLNAAILERNKASEVLPEYKTLQAAENKFLDEVYRILASHNLSSREWRPTINEKGELALVKIQP